MVWFGLPTAIGAPVDLVFPNVPACRLQAHEFAMVGDVMQHGMQLKASTQPDGGYSWAGVFDAIEPLIAGSDLAFANLETPVYAEKSFGGYPFFNSPPVLLDTLKAAGFDVLQTANNHTLDRGRSGVLATLAAVRERGFGSAGTHASAAERRTPWTLQTLPGPTRVAFLAYTYGTNGMPMPEGEPWLVDWLDRGFMEQDVARARQVADVVIVGLHWGGEYQHQPAAWQKDLARSLVEAGADVVMGSHPHVLQPAEVLTVQEPLGDRDALVLYSLGNFVSNQRTYPRDGGLIARVTVGRCLDDGSHHLLGVRFTPVWVDDRLADGTLAFRVVPIPERPVCVDDLSVDDCKRMEKFRTHAATLLPVSQFTTMAGSNPWTARAEVPTLPWTPWVPRSIPLDPVDTWPPPRLPRTQADP